MPTFKLVSLISSWKSEYAPSPTILVHYLLYNITAVLLTPIPPLYNAMLLMVNSACCIIQIQEALLTRSVTSLTRLTGCAAEKGHLSISISIQKGVIFTCFSYKRVRKAYCQNKIILGAIIWCIYIPLFSNKFHLRRAFTMNITSVNEHNARKSSENGCTFKIPYKCCRCHFDIKTSVEKGV